MEISNVAPPEYEAFSYRRFFWQHLGLRYDEMTFKEVSEAILFLDLERQHPYRQKKAD